MRSFMIKKIDSTEHDKWDVVGGGVGRMRKGIEISEIDVET